MSDPPDADGAVRPGRPARDDAVALIDLGRYEDAARVLGEAIARDPDNWRLRCDLCRCHLHFDDLAEALAATDAALALAPEREWPWRLRALTLSRMGRHPEALRAAERSVQLAPDLADAHIMLSQTLRNNNRNLDAHHVAVSAARLAPESAHTHEAVGRSMLSLGDPAGAERAFRYALSLEPTSAELCNNLGLALQRQGRENEATEMFARAAALDPTDPLYRRNVGISAHRLTKVSLPVGGLALAAGLVFGIAGFVVIVVAFGLYAAWRRHRLNRGRVLGSDGRPLAPGVADALRDYRRERRRMIPLAAVIASVVGLLAIIASGTFDDGADAFPASEGLLVAGCVVAGAGIVMWLHAARRQRRTP